MADLISRQEAIDALHMHLMYRMGTDNNKKRLDDWINGLPSAQRWIPCSERLPEEGRYLVTRHDDVSKTNFTDILWFEKNVWWNRQYAGNFAVIAWMPLPEPYREGEQDENR